MTERIASYHDNFELRGIPNQRLLNMYQKWAHGGFGIVLTGNIATHPTNLEFAGNAIICKENANDGLKKWFTEMAKIIKAEGSLAIAQLTNAGRQTPEAVERHPFSASDVQLTKPEAGRRGRPVPLTIEQIKTEVIDRYTFAAEFLYQCGFDGVQIHGAHGYLFSQFLSPTTNKRTDQYGDLPKKILSGKVNSAIRVAFPEDDFRTTVLASNSNMFAMGENRLDENYGVCSDLFDFSDPKEAERFLVGVKEYAVKFKENDKNLIPNIGVYEHQRSKESKFLSSL
ncbi:hypothetical protein WR25_20139 [Diploscapter pachys]|uniref:NADH:flavin oxidoreductase/NADH oxidase N-terminal domain-containing protein n=1 Tax=Diploscapter pachys TaxID=2018661 RepID=A0A2A2LRR1_9BILA|nr:hypothetical protein WR25_20139 [Diploscapter pachys]